MSSAANRPASVRSSSRYASRPPTSAPKAVNSSRVMPNRRFATWRWRYTLADALLVTMTDTRLTPTASRSGIPKPRVSIGTIRTPPPSPSSDPNSPAPAPPTINPRPAITSGRRPHRRAAIARAGHDRSGAQVLRRVRKERHVASALERHRQLALVMGARPRLAAWLDLRSLRQVAAQPVDFLVVDQDGLVRAEGADLPATAVAEVLVPLLWSGGGWHRLVCSVVCGRSGCFRRAG